MRNIGRSNMTIENIGIRSLSPSSLDLRSNSTGHMDKGIIENRGTTESERRRKSWHDSTKSYTTTLSSHTRNKRNYHTNASRATSTFNTAAPSEGPFVSAMESTEKIMRWNDEKRAPPGRRASSHPQADHRDPRRREVPPLPARLHDQDLFRPGSRLLRRPSPRSRPGAMGREDRVGRDAWAHKGLQTRTVPHPVERGSLPAAEMEQY